VTPAPSGEQHEIVHGEQRATIVEVGAGVRAYTEAGRAVLEAYPPDSMCDGAHGAVLIPWPNRLADGRYSFDGTEHRLALSEPDRHNAIHGLLRWQAWRALERERDRVVMGIRLHPTPGYPFTLDVSVIYELGDEGLTVSTQASNVGERACPYGAGQHPYLSPGDGLIDECTLQVPAATRVLTDADRQLPTGTEPVAGTPLDFRVGRRLAGLRVDSAFTDLARDEEGRATARLSAPDGRTVELWVDESYPVIEVYTGDTLSPARRRRGLAVEPMSCWPNAFQNGHGVTRLEPGQTLGHRWGARLV
jgi:aldose 1-epimerase